MSEYAKALGNRLRKIRQQQGLSLQGVEEKSGGRWKAVVVGSYERGDRAVTVARLQELAEFYRVPVSELLPSDGPGRLDGAGKVVIDLERLDQLPGEEIAPLQRFARAIQHQRGDYNGRVLSIRADDLRALAIVYDRSPSGLVKTLTSWGVLRA
jgi:transcriptional regulator with XRE-family HTH domain